MQNFNEVILPLKRNVLDFLREFLIKFYLNFKLFFYFKTMR